MKQALTIGILTLIMMGCAASQEPQRPPSLLSQFGGSDPDKYPVVIMQTNMGPIIIKLDAVRAPVTVKNFLAYVEAGFYTNTIFHRVIPGFMIQGGGYEPGTIRQKSTKAPIVNEASNGYRNLRGTIAMARTRDLDSATSQFYINLVDNDNLDDAKYAVFGEVTMGMETVDKIAAVPTRVMGDHQNFPIQEIIIQSVIINK